MTTPRHIGGLDVSTARIGYATPAGDLLSITSKAGSEDPVRRLWELWRGIEQAIRYHPPQPELMVIEGYSLNKPPHVGLLSKIRLGEVGAVARLICYENDIAIMEVPPASLKRFATGKGNAPKEPMILAAIRDGARGSVNDDEADAFHLRRMAMIAHGHLPATEGYQRDAIAALTW